MKTEEVLKEIRTCGHTLIHIPKVQQSVLETELYCAVKLHSSFFLKS